MDILNKTNIQNKILRGPDLGDGENGGGGTPSSSSSSDGINIGGLEVTKFYLGNSDDVKIYLGETLLYPKSTPPTVKDYLRFVAKDSGTFTFTPKSDAASGNVMSYSLDSGSTWTSANTTSTVQSGDVVFIKGEDFAIRANAGIGTFSSTCDFDVEGNVMSLLYGDNFEGETDLTGKDYALMNLFSGCTTVINADKMELPATTLSTQCYCNMFNRAINLLKAPSEMPATDLGVGCYMNMFYNCSAMTTVMDELPATTLADSAYTQMFFNCSGFTTAPMLPALTVSVAGYYRMFYYAKKVNSITCLATNKTATNAVGSWVTGVASSGTFTKNANMTGWSRGGNGIPTNWTILDYSG